MCDGADRWWRQVGTVPPTAGLVGELFGLALVAFGNYDWMWYADIVLALLAALVNLPIREEGPALRGISLLVVRSEARR